MSVKINLTQALMYRIFIGVPVVITTDFRNELEYLRALLYPNKVSWVKEELMHITVRFLGNISVNKLHLLKQEFAQIRYEKPIELSINGVELFGAKHSPKVIYADIKNTEPWLDLYDRVNDMLRAIGCNDDAYRYTPHLTLGRIRRVKDVAKIIRASECKLELEQKNLQLCLYQSQLSQYGPEYTILESVPLSNF
ncbi:RNA 2',3'-cyclic phosphodiesterase [Carboxylicivirga linearis]|uniref:RNA 2',3'-cyclic phosphodiesterase n=1 Tax=Carboxylicivirga linearis TaxID=1628157 RepID=A0ABS5JX61_9BACT|nr:RNA 2',3'-cyclic phosphodiesterase [Carboxylicivirga linearis]MBS2098936.1 RNA 2',3'-cyclic phosphodiesterase [Carboxylicivirga linearis]